MQGNTNVKHLNVILISTPRSSKRSLSFIFSHQHLACRPISLLPRTCHISRQSHSPLFDHPNSIWCPVQYIARSSSSVSNVRFQQQSSIFYYFLTCLWRASEWSSTWTSCKVGDWLQGYGMNLNTLNDVSRRQMLLKSVCQVGSEKKPANWRTCIGQ